MRAHKGWASRNYRRAHLVLRLQGRCAVRVRGGHAGAEGNECEAAVGVSNF